MLEKASNLRERSKVRKKRLSVMTLTSHLILTRLGSRTEPLPKTFWVKGFEKKGVKPNKRGVPELIPRRGGPRDRLGRGAEGKKGYWGQGI